MTPPAAAEPPARVLVVDDVAANRDLLRQTLEPAGCEVLLALHGEMALKVAVKARPEVILLDLMMPGLDGFAVCRRLKADEATRAIPVLFITAQHEVASLVEGFRAGGVDYITKPFQPDEVAARVNTHVALARATRALAAKNAELEAANDALRAEMAAREQAETSLARADERLSLLTRQEAERWGLDGFVGRSPALGRVLDEVRRAQGAPATSVLILGESGTGKELVARAIHHGSARAGGPFLPVNCTAIPEQLAESLLFGHVKGAFTGAAEQKGWFELAHGGTLFLDEIGDMPAPLQAKLLRVLEEGVIRPLGATKERAVDVRVIAATNADLPARIAGGGFRADLYYRLARLTLTVPPLRERREDVPLLAAHFTQALAAEMRRPAPAWGAAALAALEAHAWPGNVRELRNVVEGALIRCRGGQVSPEDLLLASASVPAAALTARTAAAPPGRELPLKLADAERVLLERALALAGGNVSRAAELLGVNRGWIYRTHAARTDDGGGMPGNRLAHASG